MGLSGYGSVCPSLFSNTSAESSSRGELREDQQVQTACIRNQQRCSIADTKDLAGRGGCEGKSHWRGLCGALMGHGMVKGLRRLW